MAAGALAPVPALTMAALAPNRAAGMALMKMVGLPFYLPLATWFVGLPLVAVAALLPSSWPLWALWADSAGGSVAAALAGVAVCTLLSGWLVGRLVHPLR